MKTESWSDLTSGRLTTMNLKIDGFERKHFDPAPRRSKPGAGTRADRF